MGNCIVVGAIDVNVKIEKHEDDFLIAADKGYLNCLKQNLDVDLLIGDFDSLKIVPDNIEKIKLKEIKDDTDVFDALMEGIKRGYKSFILYGVIGGRFDHTFANIQILLFLKNKGYEAKIIDEDRTYIILENESIELPKKERGYLSVFSFSAISHGVTLKNLKYELKNATLTSEFPLGVDNEYIDKSPFIEVKDGKILLIY